MSDQVVLAEEEAKKMVQGLNQEWAIVDGGLERRFEFKGYAKAVFAANTIATLCDRHGHHADVSFGWGYCNVRLITHDANGLTKQDFKLANAIDRIL